MLLRFQQYDVTVSYRPGKEMLLVDTLSCLSNPGNQDTIKLDVRIDHHSFTTSRLQQLKTETAQKPLLSLAYRYALDGWPESRRHILRIIRVYWDQQDILSTDEGLLMKGDCIVITTYNRHKTMENLHVGHQGITAMQNNARVTVYWPRIDADIEDFINRCSSYLITQPNQ